MAEEDAARADVGGAPLPPGALVPGDADASDPGAASAGLDAAANERRPEDDDEGAGYARGGGAGRAAPAAAPSSGPRGRQRD